MCTTTHSPCGPTGCIDMMNLIRNNKAFSVILGLVVLLGAGYLLFSGGSDPAGNSLLTSNAVSGPSAASRELLVTLSDLKTVRLDAAIFSDPLFQSLKDFGVQIPLQPTGRRNPFAPIGVGNIAPQAQSQGTQ